MIPSIPITAESSKYLGVLQESGTMSSEAVFELWHDVLQGLSGLDENLVRPAFQVNPPPTPGRNINWLAYHIEPSVMQKNFPDVIHKKDDEGSSYVIDHKAEDVRLYVYGPESEDIADKIRRGLHITQNRDRLFLAGIGIIQVNNPIHIALKQNENWLARHDLTINTLRQIIARYEVLNLLQAGGDVKTDIRPDGITDIRNNFDTDRILPNQ